MKREIHNRDVRINDLIEQRDRYQQLANLREQRIAEATAELTKELANERQCRKADVERAAAVEERYHTMHVEYRGYRQAIKDIWHE
jgi:hypothetical protein